MDNELPHQELVKCVVVGDTAVGKTRLICARACNSRLDLSQLMTTHIPTVWAIDQYRIHKEVLERSCEVVDSVNVSLRLWDTFGDHDKDRRFAYGRSDVVLLCFSVGNPASLRNCKLIWYPEIRKFCPNTPIVLVGCKNDLRYMYRDEKFLNLCRERSPFFRANHTCSRFPELGRPLRESDILTPEQGHVIGKELNASYYEASVFTHYGVNEVFENVIRVALLARRQQRFWMTNLKHVQKPLLQEPFCPPRPHPPKIHVPLSDFEEQLLELLRSQLFSDAILLLGKTGFACHRVVLAAVSKTFFKLFTTDMTTNSDQYLLGSSLGLWGRSASDSSVASSVDTSSGTFNADTDQLINNSSKDADHCHNKLSNVQRASGKTALCSLSSNANELFNCNYLKRRASYHFLNDIPNVNSSKISLQKNLQHSLFQTISIEHYDNYDHNRPASLVQTLVTLAKIITPGALQQCLQFLYTGRIGYTEVPLPEVLDAAELLDITELQIIIKNLENSQTLDKQYFRENYRNEYLKKIKVCLKTLCIDQDTFADIIFQLDDGTCSAHRPLLMARCDMMDAMFRGDFRESNAKVIKFPGVCKKTFKQLLYYVYTDDVDPDILPSNCLLIIELANRLCLSRLIILIENHVIETLNKLEEDGKDISEIALKLLEPCQMHNADHLSDWCLYQIAIHYNDIVHKNSKLLRNLHPENQAYLNRNRWPPVWYLKELDFFERCVRERQWEEKPPKGVKRHRYSSGCLCFSGKSKSNGKRKEYQSV